MSDLIANEPANASLKASFCGAAIASDSPIGPEPHAAPSGYADFSRHLG